MMKRLPGIRLFFGFITVLFLCGALAPATAGQAQEGQATGPVYVVQEGDTLWEIAARFRVSVDELQLANNITNANQLAVGNQLIIPGLEGVQGVLTTRELGYGETLRSLTRRFGVPADTLARLNRFTSPNELYAGSILILPEATQSISGTQRLLVEPGQSLLELAALGGMNPWSVLAANELQSSWQAIPGDVLQAPANGAGQAAVQAPGGLPEAIQGATLKPGVSRQGKVTVISLQSPETLDIQGRFMDHELHFFPDGNGNYIALQGVHAMAEPGIYPLDLQINQADGEPFKFSQNVRVGVVEYPYDEPLTVNPTTIDPAVTKPEDAEWAAVTSLATPERMWSGPFAIPSPFSAQFCLDTGECWSSRFGNRRSYNGSPYNSFHTGLDVVGREGTEIFAAAPGKVVFAGPLTVRGNATVIDHGWGVYSAYMHQSEILVKPGDQVTAGQLIGYVGATGRVEGPHLHWEVWAGGVQVDPLDWLSEAIP
jgi:murein DD-endopeptidase MepM/ murein hydrolase activator NlpD